MLYRSDDPVDPPSSWRLDTLGQTSCQQLLPDLITVAFDLSDVGDQPLSELVRIGDAALAEPQRMTDLAAVELDRATRPLTKGQLSRWHANPRRVAPRLPATSSSSSPTSVQQSISSS
jgi:hypothetical protein